jgi:hypothetical protein
MDPLQVAARFTAFTAYLNEETAERRSAEEAGRLARENWRSFMPFVDQDLAGFLTARPASRRRERSIGAPETKRKLASSTGNGGVRRARGARAVCAL